MKFHVCKDPVMLNQWHPICSTDSSLPNSVNKTMLLGENIFFRFTNTKAAEVWITKERSKKFLPTKISYGFLWTSLGTPPDVLFSFPEYHEPDRRNVSTGAFGVKISAGRVIENFLDMGHFPYVHTGILGEEPHTEVKEYDVEISRKKDEIVATKCRFYQPKAAVASNEGNDVDYIYRVPHINCAILYKTSPVNLNRLDAIVIFVQPMAEEHVCAHSGMCIVDDASNDQEIRLFQQTIFGQDKPILENQHPRKLPLSPNIETPIRADKSAIAYRRWLSDKGLKYGVIPEENYSIVEKS